ncbi:hypothetical protein HGG71_11570 [Rhodobacteraceae bacterium R_SAG2]|nr:hypothetical protein [Rhodobacteraceae bacterium R_SAG2]
MKPKKLDADDIQNAVRAAIKQAVDFCDSEVQPDRIRAAKYLKGGTELEHEEGLSKVVATVCRDTVRMVKPVLMRTFMQSGTPVEFVPVGQDDIQGAEQATAYVDWKFSENNGFRVLSNVIDDALEKKTGVAKVWWDETEEVEFDDYSNLTFEVVDAIQQDPEITVVETEQNPDGTFEVKVSRTQTSGRLKVATLAPEDFFVDSGATSLDDFFVCGDTEEMRVGDLVEQGFDFEEVYALSGRDDGTSDDEEEFQRTGYTDDDEAINDPSMRIVTVTEAYMRMDIEGTGIPKLYQFICAGTDYKVLDYTPADQVPYAVFEVDPRPHQFFGWSLVDMVIEDQDPATSLLRATIDNAHHTNNPGMIVDINQGNVEDAQNNEIGKILRAKGPGAYTPITIPSNTAAMLPMLDYYQRTIEDKAGVSKSSLGMDANALQSTTAAGVNAAVQAGSAHAELMARNLAEGGMRRLFKLMMQLTRQHASPNEMMRLNGQFVPVDPRSWNANMDLQSRVGLGTGQKEQRMAALERVLVDQQQIYQTYGPGNPIVTLSHMYNTRADLLELAGVHAVTRYYNPMNPQAEGQFLQQMQQQPQQEGSDPNAAFLQAEAMKTQQKAQESAQKFELDKIKALMSDDLKRDEMAQKRVLEAAKLLGDYGIQVNQQAIQAEQAAPRHPMQQG